MATADEIVTILGVQVSQETLQNIERFRQGIDGVISKLNALSVVAAGMFAGASALVYNVMDTASEITTLADKTGISTDALQEWSYVAKQAGVSADAVTKDLAKLNGTLDLQSQWLYGDAFSSIGVAVTDANGNLRETDDLLGDLSNHMAGLSRQQAVQLGSQLGLSEDTVVLLRQGKEAVIELRKEAHDLGYIIPEESLQIANDFRTSIVKMQTALRGLSNLVGIALMPAMQRLVDLFTKWIVTNRSWIALNAKAFMQGFVNALERVLAAIKRIFNFLAPVTSKFTDFWKSLDKTELYTHLLTGALLALLAAFAPFLIKGAALVAVFAFISGAIEDFFTYLEGGDSVIGRLAAKFNEVFPEWGRLFSAIAEKANALFQTLFSWAAEIAPKVGSALLEAFLAVGTALSEVAGKVADFVSTFSERFPAIVDAVKSLATVIKDFLMAAIEALIAILKELFNVAKTVFSAIIDGVVAGMGKVNDFLAWLGFGDKEKQKKEGAKAVQDDNGKEGNNRAFSAVKGNPFAQPMGMQAQGTKYAPLPYGSSSPTQAYGETALQMQKPMQRYPTFTNRSGAVQIQDNKTINQQIYTSDPQQAANMALKGIGASPQVNAAGLFAPVVR